MTTPAVPEIRARLAAVGDADWRREKRPGGRCKVLAGQGNVPVIVADWLTPPDALLIAHAPADLAWLCLRVEALEAALSDILLGEIMMDEALYDTPEKRYWFMVLRLRAIAREALDMTAASLTAQPAAGTEGGAG